jgi:cell division septum initiation protein DivIVA
LDGFSTQQFINSLEGWQGYTVQTETHGRDFWRTFGHDLTAQGMRPDVAAFHYAAHWIQPSPEQMKEFVYRLRPGAPGVDTPFTAVDFDRILAEQDYAPLARKWFGETLYHVPAISYIVGMYRQGVISEADLQGYHQDLGYTHQDSERFVGVDRLQKAKLRASEYHGWTPAKIGDAYVIGTLDAERVREYLGRLGGTDVEATDLMNVAQVSLDKQIWMRARTREQWRTATRVQAGLQVGVLEPDQAVQLLVGLGYPQARAEGVVEAEKANSRTAIVKQTVASVKRSYHDGYITGEGAVSLLQAAGIVPAKVDEYLALCGIQNTPRRKRRTASQIVSDLSSGMMDTTEALSRLYNLGYDQADSMLYLHDAQAKVIAREAKARASASRDARTRASTLARLAREAQQQARRLRTDLERIAPRSVLVKWLKRGIMPLAQFRLRMEQLGYPDPEISLYIADAPTQPTVAELQKLAKAKVIDEQHFRSELERLGFAAVDVNYFAAAAFPPPPPPVSPPAAP